jgi:metal-sulfur cluster biosynthetic enzyme
VSATDVDAAVAQVATVGDVNVHWLSAPVWTVERVSHDARAILASEFTVGITIGKKPAPCPRCGAPTSEESMFGASRCRAVHRCSSCNEAVEMMRS